MWHSKFHSVVDFLLDKIFAGARKDQHSISAVAARYSVGPSQYDKLLSAFFLRRQEDGQRTGRNSYVHQGSDIGLRKLGAPRHATPMHKLLDERGLRVEPTITWQEQCLVDRDQVIKYCKQSNLYSPIPGDEILRPRSRDLLRALAAAHLQNVGRLKRLLEFFNSGQAVPLEPLSPEQNAGL
jgi:hypothetical protein